MSKELQKIGYGTTRTAIETGNKDVEREPIYLSTPKEVSVLYSSTRYHLPSQERLETGISSPTAPETISSGAQIIGVVSTNFNLLGGDTDLQSVLDEIDSYLSAITGLYNVIYKDGSVDMEENWNMQKNLTVNNPDLIDYDAGGRDLNVVGNILIADPSVLYSNNVREGDFPGNTYWNEGTNWTITGGKAVFDADSGSGGITQTAAQLLSYFSSEMWYILEYTISDYYKENQGSNQYFTFSYGSSYVPEASIDLPLTNGTHKVAFKTVAGTPILDTRGIGFWAAVDADQLTFKLDDVSIKGINKSGDMDIVGNLNFTFGAVPRIGETNTPSTKTNYASIYPKSDDKAYWLDGAGNEHQLAYFESGTFEATPEGFNPAHATVTFNWYKIGDIVFLRQQDLIQGTSNVSTFKAAGLGDLPTAIRPANSQDVGTRTCRNADSYYSASCAIAIGTGGDIICSLSGLASGWANYGIKGLKESTMVYTLT